jgi:hypothetical protein
MPEMPDHDLRTSFDALSARLQAELQAQAAQLAERIAEEREKARVEAEAQRVAAVEAVRAEWDGRLQAELATAQAEAERRLTAETERARGEIENLTRAADDAADRHRKELDAVEESQGRLRAGLADATAEADRRVVAETDRIRRELEAAGAESVARARDEVRRDMEEVAAKSSAELRTEMERAVTHATTSLRDEMEQAANQATARLREEMDGAVAAERARGSAEVEGERARVQKLLSDERDRGAAELEGERLKAQTLSAALEEAQASLKEAQASLKDAQASRDEAQVALARERDATRAAEASLAAARSEQQAGGAQALIEARAEERQAHVAIVERMLGAMQTISRGRSLSDTLTALTDAAATLAPRVTLFIVNGAELRGWRAAGFDSGAPATVLGDQDRGSRALFDRALESGHAVTTASAPAPPFARLPENRSGLAVPLVVGGHGVAVLYADDGSVEDPDAPSAWPEAVQALAAHASACVSHITAVRTAQAMQQQLSAGGHSRSSVAHPATEDDSSARRYARLLVSEIKLYNEAAVRAGREKRDLLNRLRPEIDRARRLYEERVSPAVGARSTYFQQELVHTLADGDSALLGGKL